MSPTHVIVVTDYNGDEALYVGGDLLDTEGDTVYACDIAAAVGDKIIQLSHLPVEPFDGEWPRRFEELLAIVGVADMPV